MRKSLLDLSLDEIHYFKNYLKTLNSKFLDRNILDSYFEKLCLKSFNDVCKSIKYNVEIKNIDDNGSLDIFNPSCDIKLSPDYETNNKSDYVKFVSRLIFFKFGQKLVFKNFDVENFEKTFKLTVLYPDTLTKHFEKIININNLFNNVNLPSKDINISDDFYFCDDFETWLGIPISKNNSKEFNQLMLDIWLFIETSKI